MRIGTGRPSVPGPRFNLIWLVVRVFVRCFTLFEKLSELVRNQIVFFQNFRTKICSALEFGSTFEFGPLSSSDQNLDRSGLWIRSKGAGLNCKRASIWFQDFNLEAFNKKQSEMLEWWFWFWTGNQVKSIVKLHVLKSSIRNSIGSD